MPENVGEVRSIRSSTRHRDGTVRWDGDVVVARPRRVRTRSQTCSRSSARTTANLESRRGGLREGW